MEAAVLCLCRSILAVSDFQIVDQRIALQEYQMLIMFMLETAFKALTLVFQLCCIQTLQNLLLQRCFDNLGVAAAHIPFVHPKWCCSSWFAGGVFLDGAHPEDSCPDHDRGVTVVGFSMRKSFFCFDECSVGA